MVRRNGPTWPDLMIMVDGNGNKMIHPRRTLMRSARFDRKITRINHINQKFNWPKVKLKQSDSKPDSSWRIRSLNLDGLSHWCFRAPPSGHQRVTVHESWTISIGIVDLPWNITILWAWSSCFFPFACFNFIIG